MADNSKRSKKIRKGDKVIAISGNNRGQVGNVLFVFGSRAVVQGLNIRKKHIKPNQENPKGGILELEKPIHISNLKVCVENDMPVKLKVCTDEKQRKLVYKVDGQETLYRYVKKS